MLMPSLATDHCRNSRELQRTGVSLSSQIALFLSIPHQIQVTLQMLLPLILMCVIPRCDDLSTCFW